MSAESWNEDLLRSYLQGSLPADERERLELDLLRDDALFEKLQALEDEAVHDAVQSGVGTAATTIVERLQSSPAGRRRFADAERLVKALGGTAPEAQRRWWPLALAAALLAALGIAWILTRERLPEPQRRADLPAATVPPSPAAIEAPPAIAAASPGPSVLPAATPTRVVPVVTVAALLLEPGLLRGDDGPRRITLGPGIDTLRLELVLPASVEAGNSLVVVVTSADGNEVWRSGTLTSSGPAGAAKLRVDVPASALAEGDYELSLALGTPAGERPVADYALGILRP